MGSGLQRRQDSVGEQLELLLNQLVRHAAETDVRQDAVVADHRLAQLMDLLQLLGHTDQSAADVVAIGLVDAARGLRHFTHVLGE